MMCCNSHPVPRVRGPVRGRGGGIWLEIPARAAHGVMLSGDCGVAAGPDEPQLSQGSLSCEGSGLGWGDAVLGRGGRAGDTLVMLWKRGAGRGQPRDPPSRGLAGGGGGR